MEDLQLSSRVMLKLGLISGISFISVFLIEYFIKDGLTELINWFFINPKIYFFSVIIFLMIQFFLVSITNNLYLTIIITSFMLSIVLIINENKLLMRNEPLLPWDIYFVDQVINLLPALYKNINIIGTVLLVVLFCILVILIFKYTKFNLFDWKNRIFLCVISMVSLISIMNFEKTPLNNLVNNSGVQNIVWDQKENQSVNGLILGFILNIPSLKVEQPNDYSEENLVGNFQGNSESQYEISEIKPNIVVVMSEAFWEVENLDLNHEVGPLHPTVDMLKKGTLISPSFGGGTANVEFEVLTGFSLTKLPGGSIPYQQYLGRDTPSLANTLLDQGYRTTAIHTYDKDFWNRNEVYNYLGFEKFIGEEDLEDPKRHGYYIDDAVVNSLILEELTKQEQPTFIYATTMQNHGSYLDNRYGEEVLEVTNQYSNEANQMINTYATGIKHSDELLNELLNEVTKLNEPTLVVFFGDHLPLLGSVYTELEYVNSMSEQSLEELIKMKETPLVVWNNFNKDISNIGSISASFISAQIMRWAELESPEFYHFLNEFTEQMPVYSAAVKKNSFGELTYEIPEELNELEHNYDLLQYDILFGERYSEELFKVD